MELYPCPVCNHKYKSQEHHGTYEICDNCDWEDDGLQFDNPDYEGGANGYSLNEYKKRFLEGSLDEESKDKKYEFNGR